MTSWQSAHYVARGWEARVSRTSAASSSRLVSSVGYRCAQGHEFEITMSVEADVPAVWECPRCGAEALSTSRHPARGEGREAGPHPLGHAARAPLREGARGHPQGAARAAARRRDRPRAPAPRQRQEGARPSDADARRRRAAATSSTTSPRTTGHRSGSGAVVDVAGTVPAARSGDVRRAAGAPTTRVSSRRASGRVNGRISTIPNDVGDEARAEHQRAADQDQRAVGQLAWPASGPPSSATRSACQARRPSRLISQLPKMLSAISSRIVHQAPIDLADLDDHVDLDDRHHDERRDQQPPRQAAPTQPAPRGTWPALTTAASAPATCSRRSRRPHAVIRRSDSVATWPLILESPRTRSTNSIGTSRTRSPARRQRATMSVWNT